MGFRFDLMYCVCMEGRLPTDIFPLSSPPCPVSQAEGKVSFWLHSWLRGPIFLPAPTVADGIQDCTMTGEGLCLVGDHWGMVLRLCLRFPAMCPPSNDFQLCVHLPNRTVPSKTLGDFFLFWSVLFRKGSLIIIPPHTHLWVICLLYLRSIPFSQVKCLGSKQSFYLYGRGQCHTDVHLGWEDRENSVQRQEGVHGFKVRENQRQSRLMAVSPLLPFPGQSHLIKTSFNPVPLWVSWGWLWKSGEFSFRLHGDIF